MARLETLDPLLRENLIKLACPTFETTPFVSGPPLNQRRIAIVSTAGLHRRKDPPFDGLSSAFRPIPRDTRFGDLVMSHVSANFDRSGFQQDWNVVFPLKRLAALADEGYIGHLADYHYSFMGATAPDELKLTAHGLVRLLLADAVDGVLLVPV